MSVHILVGKMAPFTTILTWFQIVNSWRTRMKRKSSKETNGETYDNDETQTDIWTLYHRPDLGEA